MRVMVKDGNRDHTGPLTFTSDNETVTVEFEVADSSDAAWSLEVTVGEWNGLPRITKVVIKDYHPARLH